MHPISLDLTDRRVVVVGAGWAATARLERLLADGAALTVIAPAASERVVELDGLGALRWLRRPYRAGDLGSPERAWLVHAATGDPDVDDAVSAEAERESIWCLRADDASRSTARAEVTASGRPAAQGRVYLVGGGPGDPGLLTVRGRELLATADVVLADRLGPRDLLGTLGPGVEVIEVGKAPGSQPVPQERINALLVEHARAGRRVVRLKGGDPFVLGRGGEEALHCREHGVPVEVVPGVTSAVSVPAAAGIPVTHRGVTSSFVVASASAGGDAARRAALDAPSDATLVLLMGVGAIASTAQDLLNAGRSPQTPAAIVESGWTPRQRTTVTTLEKLAWAADHERVGSPAVVVVGDVVALRAHLGDLSRSATGVL